MTDAVMKQSIVFVGYSYTLRLYSAALLAKTQVLPRNKCCSNSNSKMNLLPLHPWQGHPGSSRALLVPFLGSPSSPAVQDRDFVLHTLKSESVCTEKTNNHRIFLPFAAWLMLSDVLRSTLA